MKKVSLKILQTKYWWWEFDFEEVYRRYGDSTNLKDCLDFWHTWLAYQDNPAAYLYEFEARVKGKWRFEKPWVDLELEEMWEIESVWFDRSRKPKLVASENPLKRPAWGTKPLKSLNLHAYNSDLIKYFKHFLSVERKRTGIPNPPRIRKGRRIRPFSWEPMRLFDLDKNGLRKERDFDSTQTSQLSKFKKSIERFKDDPLRLLKPYSLDAS